MIVPWRWANDITPQAREVARRVSAAKADARAAALAPVIAEIRASRITTAYAIAAALTARGIPTARGHRFWNPEPVRRLLNRLDRLSDSGALGSPNECRESVRSASATSAKASPFGDDPIFAAMRKRARMGT
jgi:hypothetical protein